MLIDFKYIDEHIDLIKSKTINYTTISLYNGYDNIVFLLKKVDEGFEYVDIKKTQENISYEEFISYIMNLFKNSDGKISMIYRLYMNSYNPNTNGEFVELWADILYVDIFDHKLKSINISAQTISNMILGFNFTEKEIKIFGRPEDYIYKDNEGNIIMGIDLA